MAADLDQLREQLTGYVKAVDDLIDMAAELQRENAELRAMAEQAKKALEALGEAERVQDPEETRPRRSSVQAACPFCGKITEYSFWIDGFVADRSISQWCKHSRGLLFGDVLEFSHWLWGHRYVRGVMT